MSKKRREAGIIGCGMSHFSSHREEVNQPEMVHEAVAQGCCVPAGQLQVVCVLEKG